VADGPLAVKPPDGAHGISYRREVSAPPDLPPLYRRGTSVYDLVLDDRAATWTLWDRDGCIGEIVADDSGWSWRFDAAHATTGPFETWQGAVDGLLAAPIG